MEQARAQLAQENERLEGVRLAARSVAHSVNNDLVLGVGALEMLAIDPALPSALQPLIQQGQRALGDAAAEIEALQRVTHVVEMEMGGAPGSVLDLLASTTPTPSPLRSGHSCGMHASASR